MAQINYQPETVPTIGTSSRATEQRAAVDSRAQAIVVALISALAGLLIAIIWDFEVADTLIGATIANAALGANAKEMALDDASALLGIGFAFAAGLAATFTACNAVVFSCIAPLVAERQSRRVSLLRLLGWMTLGIVIVTASYGAIGAIVGRSIPILSSARLPIGTGDGFPVRLLQSMTVFVALGVILVGWGAHVLGLSRNPLARLSAGRDWFKPLALGLLIGGFTVGRPFGLFRKALEHAVDTGNPLFSATAIMIQGLGNIAVMVAVLLLLTYGTGGRFERWMRRSAGRVQLVTAISLIAGGVFFIAYWGLRLPARFGIGWFPSL